MSRGIVRRMVMGPFVAIVMILSLVLGGPISAALADDAATPGPEPTVDTGQDVPDGDPNEGTEPEGDPTEGVDPVEEEPTEVVDPVQEEPTEVTTPEDDGTPDDGVADPEEPVPADPAGDEGETPVAADPDAVIDEAPLTVEPASLTTASEPESIGVMSVTGTNLSPTSISVLPGASIPATLTINMSGPTGGLYSITRPSGVSLSAPNVSGSGGLGRTCTGARGPISGDIGGSYSLGLGNATCTISFTVNVSGTAPAGNYIVNTTFGSIAITVVSPLTAAGDEITVQYMGTGSGAVTASGGTGAYFYALDTVPAKGTATVNGDGTFAYTASEGYSGEDDSFTVVVTDTTTRSQSTTATVTVHIGTMLEATGTTIKVSYTGTGTGAVTATGGTPDYTYAIDESDEPKKGEASVDADGVVTYTANADESGEDTFTVIVTDSGDQPSPQTASALVTVTIGEPLVVQDAWIDVAHNGSESGQIEGDGGTGPFTAALGELPTKGTVEVDPDTGEFTYTADEGAYGDDSFTATVTDSGDPQLTDTATVYVTIAPAELTVETLQLTLMAGHSMTGDLSDQVSGGVPPYTFAVDQEPSQGTLVLSPNGTFAYVANADATGTDSFTYTVTDSDEEDGPVLLAVTTGTVEITFAAQPVTPTPTVEPTTTPDPTETPSPTVEPTTAPTQTPSPAATPKATTAVTGLPSTGTGATDRAMSVGWLLATGGLMALGGALTWRRKQLR